MTPDVPIVLNGIVRSLMMDLGPELQSPYAMLTAQLASPLLMMIAQEFDRAAARLAEENEALGQLFHDARDVVTEPELRAALADAAAGSQASLLVSALRERNRSLRALLVRLHAHVDTLKSAAAQALDARIWVELAASTQRRHLDLAIG